MSVYSDDQERAIRVMRLVNDWTRSALLGPEQRDQIAPELHVDLRRTNKFLRATLFVFAIVILWSVMGLVAIATDLTEEAAFALLAAGNAVVCLVIANQLVDRFRLYRFGVEEAAAVAGVGFAIASAWVFALAVGVNQEGAAMAGLVTGCLASFGIFVRFGYVYAAIGSMICAAAVPFVPGESDVIHRLLSIAVLVGMFAVARSIRNRHGREHPGDSYAIVEAAAWAGIYLITNLQLSSWMSHSDDGTPFYWATYAATWVLPAMGLWIAVIDRHRALLDVNAVLAVTTLMTNKAYLGAERQPYDPIAFGVLLIAIAVGLRRWLASGDGGSRNGFIAERILESEKERLGVAATLSVSHHGSVASRPQPGPPPQFGGGTSGGAGASGSF